VAFLTKKGRFWLKKRPISRAWRYRIVNRINFYITHSFVVTLDTRVKKWVKKRGGVHNGGFNPFFTHFLTSETHSIASPVCGNGRQLSANYRDQGSEIRVQGSGNRKSAGRGSWLPTLESKNDSRMGPADKLSRSRFFDFAALCSDGRRRWGDAAAAGISMVARRALRAVQRCRRRPCRRRRTW
jgi:hypothetical protein